MTNLDEMVIEHLRRSPRATVTELAAAAYYPRRAVRARLEALIGSGALRVVAAVHPGYLGVNAYAHLSIATTGRVRHVLDALVDLTEVVLVSVVSGRYQIVAEVRQSDQQQLSGTVAAVRALPGVWAVNVLTYVEVLRGTFMPLQALRPDRDVDAIDEALMAMLEDNGRASYRSLADAVGLSASAARARVTALLADEVIRIAPVLHHGLRSVEVTAGIGINVANSGQAVEQFLRQAAGIDFAARTLGRHDLVATILADSARTLIETLDEIRALDDVATVTSWVHLDIVKERYERPRPSAEIHTPPCPVVIPAVNRDT